VSAEVLRKAATQLRTDYSAGETGAREDDPFMFAVADLLDLLARRSISTDLEHAERDAALVVARAYLEEES
jgi:hypothetical protein